MLTPRTEDTIHTAQLYRLLMALADDLTLMQVLRFKGGTCAAMAGWLDRFSVDLDFDYTGETTATALQATRAAISQIAAGQGLSMKDHSQRGIQFFFKYPAAPRARNTLKVEAQFPPPASNQYAPLYLSDIDRTLICQTQETMFANKLVAVLDRFEHHGSIAGRDLFDIYHFFAQGFSYDEAVIEERRGVSTVEYLQQLIQFITQHVTTTTLQQDLNPLLPADVFAVVGSQLKPQVLLFLKTEVDRLSPSTSPPTTA